MILKTWHDDTIRQIQTHLESDSDVVAAALFGSSRNDTPLRDEWSDIDVVVVVGTDKMTKYYPTLDWVSVFGEIFAVEQSTGPVASVTRCCFRDGRKIDFLFSTRTAIESNENHAQLPWRDGSRVLFARTEDLRAQFEKTSPSLPPPLINEDEFEKMTQVFRFKGLAAIGKIGRNDLLIALHLILEMMQDCCVLGLILRDRSEGSNCHRTGGIANIYARELQPIHFECSSGSLLDEIERLLPIYDSLALKWDAEYGADSAPLLNAIKKARKTISK